GGQLVAYRSPPFVYTFAYDDRGRLAHETLTSPQENETSDWRYDAAGRLVSRISRGNEWTWTYDDAGRVIRSTNGGSSKVYTYSAHCAAKLNVPALPTGLSRAHLVPCTQTAGDL